MILYFLSSGLADNTYFPFEKFIQILSLLSVLLLPPCWHPECMLSSSFRQIPAVIPSFVLPSFTDLFVCQWEGLCAKEGGEAHYQ